MPQNRPSPVEAKRECMPSSRAHERDDDNVRGSMRAVATELAAAWARRGRARVGRVFFVAPGWGTLQRTFDPLKSNFTSIQTICQGINLWGYLGRASCCLGSTATLDVRACKHTPANTNAHPTVVCADKKSRSPVDSIRNGSDRRVRSQPARPAGTAHSSLTWQSERRDHQAPSARILTNAVSTAAGNSMAADDVARVVWGYVVIQSGATAG